MEAAFAGETPELADPADTNFPLESIEKIEMSGEPLKLVTYTNLPEESMAMAEGLLPVATGLPIAESTPVVRMPNEKALLLPCEAT
jgi:hypothetical protein